MAEAFVEEIYKYAGLITQLNDVVLETRKGRKQYAEEIINAFYGELCNCCKDCMDAGYMRSIELSKSILKMSEYQENFMLLCDHIQENVLPVLKGWVSYYADIDVDTEEGYRIKSSRSGYLTIQIKETGDFVHSTYDPMEEARIYIENLYDPQCAEYVFWGCGLGYYMYQLYKISYGSVKMTVYESDPKLVEYARNYGVLAWIPEDILKVIVDPDARLFVQHCNRTGVGSYLHFAEVNAMEDGWGKQELTKECISYNTRNGANIISTINVNRNIKMKQDMKLPDVTEIGDILSEAVVVAAGPSLDGCMDRLKEWKGKKTIIAVNTIFRKLIQNGIQPDYVTALDPTMFMTKHLEGIEDQQVPLILDLGVCWKWTRDYKGPKFLAYSTYSCQEAVAYIRENGKEKWPSGGTVTFLALEFAIRKGAKKIFLVGVDLGYPGGVSHASGTAFGKKMDQKLLEVEAVGGRMVQTDPSMNYYRCNIEARIEQVQGEIEFYNLSTVGARIKGTIELEESNL